MLISVNSTGLYNGKLVFLYVDLKNLDYYKIFTKAININLKFKIMKKLKKLKLNKAKLAFEMLESEMSIISKTDDLKSYIGGRSRPNDCVIAAFDYLDGPSDSSEIYQNNMMLYKGYNTYSTNRNFHTSGSFLGRSHIVPKNNGVRVGDVADVGAYGGLVVTELNETSSGSSDGVALYSSGITQDGGKIMMSFNGATGVDHAVVVTGANSNGSLEYYDPTTGLNGTRSSGDWSALYKVQGWQ